MLTRSWSPRSRTCGRAPRHLAGAVASGGTLLVVGHDFSDMTKVPRPELLNFGWSAQEVVGVLGVGWTIEVAESRPREAVVDGVDITIHDTILPARRH
jgi:hypothetical protein